MEVGWHGRNSVLTLGGQQSSSHMAHLEGPLRFKDKVAIITGSGQGIGQSIAKALAREAALFLLSDGTKHISGEILDVNGGLLMD